MDNDLMARRLRPPSEPAQPVQPLAIQPMSQPGSDQTDDPQLPQWTPALVPPSPLAPPPQDVAAAPSPWTPDGREEVPWDRPDDFDQPTDTASDEEQAAWDKPSNEIWVDPNPMWPPEDTAAAASAAVSIVGAPQTVERADPDDAFAPVLGDVSPPVARAWPETNGHDADRNAASIGSAASAVPAGGIADSQPSADQPLTSWPLPSSAVFPNPLPNPPKPLEPEPFEPETLEPSQWPSPAQPNDYAEHNVGPTPPFGLFGAAAAAALPERPAAPAPPAAPPERPIAPPPAQLDADAWLADTPAWPSEPPTPDVPPVVDRLPAELESVRTEPVVEETPTVAVIETTPAPAAAATTPVVIRIELAIVDDQLRVVNSADSARNATVAPLAPLAGEPAQQTWSQQFEPATIPPATIAAPWASSAFATQPQPYVQAPTPPPLTAAPLPMQAPAAYTPWAQNPVARDPLAAIPAHAFVAQPPFQPMPSAQPVQLTYQPRPYQQQASQPAHVYVAPMPEPVPQPMPAPAYQQPIAPIAQPDDVDAASDEDEEVASKEPPSWWTAVLTIGMAIAVIALLFLFFSVLTSLLG